MIPQHKNPSYKNRVAIAPYNFVPLPEAILTVEKSPDHDRYDPSLLTGKLTCILTTASPLYVRAAQTWEEYSHKNEKGEPDPITPSDPFYGETRETLLIPGSSLRGMLRNLVEVVSYSQIGAIMDTPLVYRAVGDTTTVGQKYRESFMYEQTNGDIKFLVRAGYLQKTKSGNWEIIPANEVVPGTNFGRIEQSTVNVARLSVWKNSANAWHIFVQFDPLLPHTHNRQRHPVNLLYSKVVRSNPTHGAGLQEGVLVKTGYMDRKHLDFVFGLPHSTISYPIEEKAIDLYQTQVTDAQKEFLHNPDGALLNGQPVFFTTDNTGNVNFFGHPMMFRIPYLQSPADMMPSSLQQDDDLDLAQAMFGHVNFDSKIGNVAGRIFITDAVWDGKTSNPLLSDTPITLKILSGPKPTTVQHYLTQSTPDGREMMDYNKSPESQSILRGFKFYWHKGSVDMDRFEASISEVNAHRSQYSPPVKPVRDGQSFDFDIHFENIRPQELGALLWVLDRAKDKYRLKLGMGKPYGFGSVGIRYDIHLDDRKKRYQALFDEHNTWNLPQEQTQTKVAAAQNAFEQFVLNNNKNKQINPSNAKRIDDLPRIQELLALLAWEDRPAEEMTRYMKLEQFTGRMPIFEGVSPSKRPVLPSATNVANHQWFAGLPSEEPRSGNNRMQSGPRPASSPSQAQRQQAFTPPPAVVHTVIAPRTVTPPPEPRQKPIQVERPAPVEKKPGDLKIGEYIKAVVGDEPKRKDEDVLLTPSMAGEDDCAIIEAKDRGTRKYRTGSVVLLKITKIEGDSKKGFVLTCEPYE